MSKISGPGEKEPLHALTNDDRGAIIIIVAYSWIAITTIITVIRLGLAWSTKVGFKFDDATFVFGVAFAITTSVCFHLSVNGGLGRHMASVDIHKLHQFYTMMYAGELIGIAAMIAAKISIVVLTDRVAPRKPLQYNAMLGLITVWAVFAIFGTGFQCSLPQPWVVTPSSCPRYAGLQYAIIIFNIVTDALLAVWIWPTLWKLLMDTRRRLTVMVLFGSRLIVCLFGIAQLLSATRHIHSNDVTYESFGRILWGLCTVYLSVLHAAIPRTNRFIVALQSMQTTTVLTEYELAQHSKTSGAFSKGTSTQPSGTTDMPGKACLRRHSISPSRRSNRSEEPLVSVPLKLTPEEDQGFSAYITSALPSSGDGGQMQSGTVEHSDREDFRRHVRKKTKNQEDLRRHARGKTENQKDLNEAAMLSWKSASSYGDRILRTREVKQEVHHRGPSETGTRGSKK